MRLAALASIAAVATILSLTLSALATQDTPATVRLDAPSRVNPGSGPFDVAVNVENATNLGGFEVRLTFDPQVIAPDTNGALGVATKGEFLGSSGREVICPDPAVQGSLVLIRCVSLKMEPAAPSGNGTLATFHFLPVAKGKSELTFTQARLLSPDGQTDYKVNSVNDSVRVANAGSSKTLIIVIAAVAAAAILGLGAAVMLRTRRS